MTVQQAVATPPRRRATYQDVLDAPPHKVAEIIDGALQMSPRPAFPHARASSKLGGKLTVFDEDPGGRGGGPGGWWIIDEPELHLGDDVLVPDLAGWRRERMPQCPDTAYCAIAPDWVCEVLSPSTRKHDLGRKRAIYAREGVRWLWFIDPDTRTLEALERSNDVWVVVDILTDDAAVSLPPFDKTTFRLNALWIEAARRAGDADRLANEDSAQLSP